MNMQKILTILMWFFLGAMLLQPSAYAREEKERCFKPKFRSFDPPNNTEVAPGSEISFHAKNVDKTKLFVTVKGIPIDVTLEDRKLFYIVRGKLPDSLVDTYARISLSGTAELGCKAKDGWLVKISATPTESIVEETSAPIDEEATQTVDNPESTEKLKSD